MLSIGAGIGVPLGVIALASLAWAFWLQRQNRNLKKEHAQGLGQGQLHGQMGIMMPGVDIWAMDPRRMGISMVNIIMWSWERWKEYRGRVMVLMFFCCPIDLE